VLSSIKTNLEEQMELKMMKITVTLRRLKKIDSAVFPSHLLSLSKILSIHSLVIKSTK
jgi:hypothetical protein